VTRNPTDLQCNEDTQS